MSKLISVRYAKALFDLALESQKISNFEPQVKVILDALNNDEFIGVFNHPQVSSTEKFEILKNAFEGNVEPEIMGVFQLIIKKNRESEIIPIFKELLSMIDEHNGVTTAYVHSAKRLTNEQIYSIKEKLSKNLNKQIIVKANIQEDLIGGIKIVVDDIVIDATVKKQLSDIKKGLLQNKLAQ